jgi:hypothetical protein
VASPRHVNSPYGNWMGRLAILSDHLDLKFIGVHKDLCIDKFRVRGFELTLRYSALSATQVSHRIIIQRFRSEFVYGLRMDYSVFQMR